MLNAQHNNESMVIFFPGAKYLDALLCLFSLQHNDSFINFHILGSITRSITSTDTHHQHEAEFSPLQPTSVGALDQVPLPSDAAVRLS